MFTFTSEIDFCDDGRQKDTGKLIFRDSTNPEGKNWDVEIFPFFKKGPKHFWNSERDPRLVKGQDPGEKRTDWTCPEDRDGTEFFRNACVQLMVG